MILDTHTWIWMILDPSKLSRIAERMIQKHSEKLGIADISLWETALLVHKGWLNIHLPLISWLNNAVQESRVMVYPITTEIAYEGTLLPLTLSDPADRLIASTAKCLGMKLLSKDGKMRALAKVETLW